MIGERVILFKIAILWPDGEPKFSTILKNIFRNVSRF
jgi:hypothetical protein